MSKVNVQVRLSRDLANQIENLAVKSKSNFLREAIQEKIKKEMNRRLEEKWISALQKNPQKTKSAKDWLKIEKWD